MPPPRETWAILQSACSPSNFYLVYLLYLRTTAERKLHTLGVGCNCTLPTSYSNVTWPPERAIMNGNVPEVPYVLIKGLS